MKRFVPVRARLFPGPDNLREVRWSRCDGGSGRSDDGTRLNRVIPIAVKVMDELRDRLRQRLGINLRISQTDDAALKLKGRGKGKGQADQVVNGLR